MIPLSFGLQQWLPMLLLISLVNYKCFLFSCNSGFCQKRKKKVRRTQSFWIFVARFVWLALFSFNRSGGWGDWQTSLPIFFVTWKQIHISQSTKLRHFSYRQNSVIYLFIYSFFFFTHISTEGYKKSINRHLSQKLKAKLPNLTFQLFQMNLST